MNIARYEALTGTTVATANRNQVTAQIKRTRFALEALLGYTLDKVKSAENQYEELGKTRGSNCGCDDIDGPYDDPDTVQGAYRLFSYNRHDKYLEVDPFTKLYAVKLVFIKQGGDNENGVTIRTFEEDEVRVHIKNGFSKYIEKCEDCFCVCNCNDCVQLAVDADWLYSSCLPEELEYLWADAVTHEINAKKDIKRETLGSHTYERFDRHNTLELPESIKIIQKYAGPNGTVNRTITI
jgi:hypothetical protein